MQHVLPDQCHHHGKLAVVLTSVVCLLGLGGITISQANATTALASATVIAPVNVMTSWADLPVKVVWSGGWIRLAMPSAQPPPPVSSPSNPLKEADLVVGFSSSRSGAPEGTVHGEFTTFQSAPTPLDGSSYRVTVAFN